MVGELLLRFAAGGGLVVLVTMVARTKHRAIAGVVMLFPATTLIGYYFVGRAVSAEQLHMTTAFSMYALATTLIFFLVFYYTQERMSVNKSLCFATAAWFMAAGILVGVTYA